jgi:hypothetical protein
MLAVVSHEQGVTNSNIQVSVEHDDTGDAHASVHVFLQYTYHPHSLYLPREHVQRLDVTDLVTTKHESMVFGGVVTAPHTSLNEINDDLFTIADKMRAKCGLNLDGITE